MAGIKLYQFLLNGQVFKDPENWKNFIPTIETHETYKTLLAQFSSDRMIFVKDAKNYIDEEYEKTGALTKVTIQVKKYNLDTGLYENYFTAGRLDFKRYKRKRDRTEVGFEPSDFVMKVLNRDEVVVSLQKLEDMDGNAITPFTNETIDLELDQQTFNRSLESNTIEDIELVEELTGSEQPLWKYAAIQPSIFEVNEVIDNIEIEGSEFIDIQGGTTVEGLSSIYKALRDVSINFKLEYDLRAYIEVETITPTPNSTVEYNDGFNFRVLHYKKEEDTTDELYNDLFASQFISGNSGDGSANSERSLSGNVDVDVDLKEGDIIYVRQNVSPRGQGLLQSFTFSGGDVRVISGIEFTTFELLLTETRTDPTTTAKCMLAWEFILRQCQIITGRNDCLRSSFYGRTDGEVYQYDEDGNGSMYAFSNGKLIRGFPIEKAPMNTFLMQTFKSLEGMGHLLGLGITYESDVPYVTIEPLSFWKDKSTVVMTLQADENGIEWEPALKYIWGSVKCGYKNYKNESSFLLGTAHALKEYSLADINEISNTIYEVTCDFVGSGHLLENIRNQRYALDTQKDTDYDENIFVIAVKRDGSGGFERKKITEFESVTGIDNVDSQYNIELHPARVLLNHAPLLLAAYAKRIANEPTNKTFLQFRSGEANNELETKYATKPAISEGVDLTFDELDGQEALFDASEMGTCTVKLSDMQIQQFKSGFIGAVNVSDQTGTYKCLVDMVKQTDLENNKTELRIFKVVE